MYNFVFVTLSNSRGETVKVNRYFLELYNEFYQNILRSFGALDELYFIYENTTKIGSYIAFAYFNALDVRYNCKCAC